MKKYLKICSIDLLWIVFLYLGMILFIYSQVDYSFTSPKIGGNLFVIALLSVPFAFPEVVAYFIPPLIVLNMIFFISKLKTYIKLIILLEYVTVFLFHMYMLIDHNYYRQHTKDIEYNFLDAANFFTIDSIYVRGEFTVEYTFVLFTLFMILKWYLIKRFILSPVPN